jgi:hypothetical protein
MSAIHRRLPPKLERDQMFRAGLLRSLAYYATIHVAMNQAVSSLQAGRISPSSTRPKVEYRTLSNLGNYTIVWMASEGFPAAYGQVGWLVCRRLRTNPSGKHPSGGNIRFLGWASWNKRGKQVDGVLSRCGSPLYSTLLLSCTTVGCRSFH